MTSEELADEVESLIRKCRDRVLGVGNEQYSREDGSQNFEHLPFPELFEWISEELQDVVAYAAMLNVRVSRLAEALKDHG